MISKYKLFKELREFFFQIISDIISSTASEFIGTRLEEWYENIKTKTLKKETQESKEEQDEQ